MVIIHHLKRVFNLTHPMAILDDSNLLESVPVHTQLWILTSKIEGIISYLNVNCITLYFIWYFSFSKIQLTSSFSQFEHMYPPNSATDNSSDDDRSISGEEYIYLGQGVAVDDSRLYSNQQDNVTLHGPCTHSGNGIMQIAVQIVCVFE